MGECDEKTAQSVEIYDWKDSGSRQNRLYFCEMICYTSDEGKGVPKTPLPFSLRGGAAMHEKCVVSGICSPVSL